MYEYYYDEKSGALVVDATRKQERSIRDPRPVWWEELDRLGFGERFDYPRGDRDSAPIMWAEMNRYYYCGRYVGKVKALGSDVDSGVDLQIDDYFHDRELHEVDMDAMNELNADGVAGAIASGVDHIRSTYERYKDTALCYVAFSGGKDSAALLGVAFEALKSDEFSVLYGNTGFDMPETFDTVEETRRLVESRSIRFIDAKSPFDPIEAWRLFGPPSRRISWCCQLKSSAQTNALREVMTETGAGRSVAFCGVRWAESPRRATYDYDMDGIKIAGQVSSYPILNWTSAEVWATLFREKLPINRAYRNGFNRVGCLLCPRTNGVSTSRTVQIYPKETAPYIEIIEKADKREEVQTRGYFKTNGWRVRFDGAFLSNNPTLIRYRKETDGELVVRTEKRVTDWKEWFKILGDLQEKPSVSVSGADGETRHDYTITFHEKPYDFYVVGDENDDNSPLEFHVPKTKGDVKFKSRFKVLLRRAAFCVACRVCEANCPRGAIAFKDGQVRVSDRCVHCYQCMRLKNEGCERYKSLCKSKRFEDD